MKARGRARRVLPEIRSRRGPFQNPQHHKEGLKKIRCVYGGRVTSGIRFHFKAAAFSAFISIAWRSVPRRCPGFLWSAGFNQPGVTIVAGVSGLHLNPGTSGHFRVDARLAVPFVTAVPRCSQWYPGKFLMASF